MGEVATSSPTVTQMPTLQAGMQSPIINLSEMNKESIVKVMFGTDDRLVDWHLNDFYDSHLEKSDKGDPLIVPNANVYKCPKCGAIKRKDSSMLRAYTTCAGSKKRSHTSVYTQPIDWKNKLSRAGISFMLGQIGAAINANIGTANYGKSATDVKKNAEMEDRLMYGAYFVSCSILAILISEYKTYVADWVIKEKQLANIFSEPFCANFIVQMSYNILGNLSKGKGMEAIAKVLESRIRTETEAHTYFDYPPGRGPTNTATKSRLLDFFNFNK